MTKEDIEKEREKFEAAIVAAGFQKPKRDKVYEYAFWQDQARWLGWMLNAEANQLEIQRKDAEITMLTFLNRG